MLILKKSPIRTKKWRVIGPGYTVDFGARGYSDYTMHKDKLRKQRYIIRHASRENWKDPKTAGFWSRWLLWEKPSFNAAVRFVSRKLKQPIQVQ